jgi:hypothetical protein
METVGTAVDRVSLGEKSIKHTEAKERVECARVPEWFLEGNVASG